ncbi:MAG: S8 family serine peptidase [Halobacteriota archaeon]
MKKIVAVLMAMVMVMSVTVAFAGGAATTKEKQPEKIPVIIMFKDQTDKDLIKQHGGELKSVYQIKPALAASLPQKAIDGLKKNPKIAFIVPDLEIFTMAETLDWGVDRIDADIVHEYNRGTGVKVAIMDTGIDYDHPDLAANYKGGYDFGGRLVWQGRNDDDPMDKQGHGTHCAGIVAAVKGNGIGVIGVAPEAYLYAVKVFDDRGNGRYSDVIEGLEWCIDNDIHVISMSFGSAYTAGDPGIEPWINAAYDAGILLVGAAGNEGSGEDTVIYPARYANVIAVAAMDISDDRTSFSSTGPTVELSAPGVNIKSTYLNNAYATMSGTSMACPHVTGTAALVIASESLSNNEVRLRLQQTAEDLGTTGKDNLYGYGLVDAFEAAPGDLVPVVDIMSPAEGSTVSVTIVIEADASDDVGVTKVDFYIDDTLLATDIEAPYSCSWDSTSVADGSHIIKATATDTIEQTASDTITVDVDNVDDPPTVEITSPVDGATVSGTITIEASASDDKGISKVDFFINDTLLATDTEAPYNASWDTTTVADGPHNITAIATDTAAQTASDTNGVTVDNTPPANVMHVSAIDMRYDTAGPNYFIYTKVTIVDSNETPVAEATVYLEMTLPDDSKASDSGSTNGEGTVTFKLKSRQTGTYNSTVTNVTKTDNWTYDSGANEVTSDRITV